MARANRRNRIEIGKWLDQQGLLVPRSQSWPDKWSIQSVIAYHGFSWNYEKQEIEKEKSRLSSQEIAEKARELIGLERRQQGSC